MRNMNDEPIHIMNDIPSHSGLFKNEHMVVTIAVSFLYLHLSFCF